MPKLVIVESPTKARTIRNYLPSEYRVEASMGHVRDLPPSANDIPEEYKAEKWARIGVNVEADFEPLYIIPKDKQKVVKQLRDALKEADELVLATDEDREGESISWHLLQILKPKIPIKRMVFHEITKEAIREALNNCRKVDEKVVRAQETRRILDRLVGYTLSPLLWSKVASKLSAGRVQSVAVRLLVNRERQRLAFRQGSYWDLAATLFQKEAFGAKLTTVAGVKVATGTDFNPDTGEIIAGKKVVLLNEEEALALKERLDGETWTVKEVEERAVNRKPAPPFTTSTLQQESNRKLRLSAKETMRVAQSLYEQGYITYMRTDSVHLSDQAIEAARSCVMEKYGAEYLSPKPRQYTTKAKGAQEAHEAIRPAGSSFRTPRETGLGGQELSLYDLIWKRTVACQMADSRQTNISVDLEVLDAGFRATGKRIDFPGFLRAYVEGSDDPNAALENQEVILPPLKAGDHPECKELEAIDHETQPPARFTEASLVKMLESEGIGRPSTYATVIGTIAERGYAKMQGQALTPTFTAFAVTSLLEKHFPDLVDTKFTAKMEQTLDDISTGEVQWLPYLKKFYLGETGLQTQVKEQGNQIDRALARTIQLENLEAKIRLGGRSASGGISTYVEATNGDEVLTASIPDDWTPADADPEKIAELLRQKAEGPVELGKYPETGESIYFFKIGFYGPYIQVGQKTEDNPKPKSASIPKTQNLEEVTLDLALNLLSLPKLLGKHPGTDGKIKASIGPFGPYVVHEQGKGQKDYRSLKASDNIFTITLERALELLAEPKKGRGGRTKTAPEPLRTLGNHPDDDAPIEVHDGRYGPYIKHGKTNVSLPKETTVEEVTLAQALELLATKSPAKKSTRTSTKSTKSKTSTTARKTTTKKAAKTS
jgi:DNA topoisomerase I